jgi:ubiquinone/menaquinone biosynthesis C-methylase UbiE
LFFREYASVMAARLDVIPGMRVLETACGTGIVTERVVARLAGGGSLVATDLNAPMLAYAAAKLSGAANVTWREADATALPFEDRSFDAVVCQFGLMFSNAASR